MKTVGDFLKGFDGIGLDIVLWCDEDPDDPVWSGSLYDMPYWLLEFELDYEAAEDHKPISFRTSLGEEHRNRPGLVIIVK